MKTTRTYLFLICIVIIVQFQLMGQQIDTPLVDLQLLDSSNTNILEKVVDSSYVDFDINHTISVSILNSSFDQGATRVLNYNIGWSIEISETFSISNNIGLLRDTEKQFYNLNNTFLLRCERHGGGLSINYSNNPIAPSSSINLNTYHWLSDKFILNTNTNRINFKHIPNLWPVKISGTFLTGRIGWTLGVTQDIAQLGSFNPLINWGVTHETTNSDVYSAYISLGTFYQPEFRFQLIDNASSQLAYGAWLRKRINNNTSISTGWGINRIKNSNQETIQSTQVHLSISYKL